MHSGASHMNREEMASSLYESRVTYKYKERDLLLAQ